MSDVTKEELTDTQKLNLRACEAYPERVEGRRAAGLPVWDDVKAEFGSEHQLARDLAPQDPEDPQLGAAKTVSAEELGL
jgi:hypothetical protein